LNKVTNNRTVFPS